jgi:formylmethanofuran dehydrogenase subunit C
MSTGELAIEGRAGRYVGTRMTGGTVHVAGDAGDGAGLEMAGGVLRIDGDAGDRVGGARLGASRGMLGGEIVVRGAVGVEAGSRMRRGLLVCARAGARAGEAMIAGSILALGDVGDDPGRYNKRGSIVVLGAVQVPAGYAYDCTYEPPHVALTLRMLRARFGVAVEDGGERGRYRRYSGDMSELGRGELLVREGA